MHDPHALPGDDVVVAGVRLHVVRHGRDARAGCPPILLLHGLGTTRRLWSDVARDLEHDHRSIIPDLAGCGRSERPASARCSPAGQAEVMLELLSTLQCDSAVVAGHDVGGAVAVHMAAIAPERVAALVLVSTPLHADAWPPPALTPWLVPGLRTVVDRVVRLRADLTGRAASRVAGGELDADTAESLRGVPPIAAGFDAEAAAAALDVVAAAPPPTLVLWGEDDTRLAPSYGARVAADVPGATWVPVAGAGHLLPLERPERVAEEIAGFLADVPAVAAG
ncbi:MAG: alpha/beta fold hydrolase [Actinomycetes bacterium]